MQIRITQLDVDPRHDFAPFVFEADILANFEHDTNKVALDSTVNHADVPNAQ